METWVRSRDAWISSVAVEGSLAKKAQHWREYLITDLSVSKVTNKCSKSAKRRQHVRSVVIEKLSSNTSVAPRSTVG